MRNNKSKYSPKKKNLKTKMTRLSISLRNKTTSNKQIAKIKLFHTKKIKNTNLTKTPLYLRRSMPMIWKSKLFKEKPKPKNEKQKKTT